MIEIHGLEPLPQRLQVQIQVNSNERRRCIQQRQPGAVGQTYSNELWALHERAAGIVNFRECFDEAANRGDDARAPRIGDAPSCNVGDFTKGMRRRDDGFNACKDAFKQLEIAAFISSKSFVLCD